MKTLPIAIFMILSFCALSQKTTTATDSKIPHIKIFKSGVSKENCDEVKSKSSSKNKKKRKDTTYPCDTSSDYLQFYGTEDLKAGDLYYIQIDNVNQYLYDIFLDYKDTTYSSSLNIPSFTSLDLSTLSGLVDIVSSVTLKAEEIMTNADSTVSEAVYKKLCYHHHQNTLLSLIGKQKLIKDDLSNHKDTLNSIQAKINEYLINGRLLSETELPEVVFITNTQDRIKAIYSDVGKIKKTLDKFDKDKKALDKKIQECEKALLAEAKKVRQELNPKSAQNIKALKESATNLQAAIDAASKSITELKSLSSANKINELVSPLINLVNNKSKTYTSLPMQMRNNRIELSIDIKPRNDTATILPKYSTKVYFPNPKRTKIGVGAMFYGSMTTEERISFAPTDSIGFDGILEDEVKGEIGFSTPFTFGITRSTHLLVGPAVSISSTPRLRGVFGGGFSIGDLHNLTINFGAIFGNYNKISNAVQGKSTFITVPEQSTVSSFETNLFISVGYLFNTRK